MANHRTRIIESGQSHYAVCTCRAASEHYPHRWQAEDWIMRHRALWKLLADPIEKRLNETGNSGEQEPLF